jgi:hypothetical protein
MTSVKIDLGNCGADISNWQADREFDPTLSVIILKNEGAQLQTLCAWMGGRPALRSQPGLRRFLYILSMILTNATFSENHMGSSRPYLSIFQIEPDRATASEIRWHWNSRSDKAF